MVICLVLLPKAVVRDYLLVSEGAPEIDPSVPCPFFAFFFGLHRSAKQVNSVYSFGRLEFHVIEKVVGNHYHTSSYKITRISSVIRGNPKRS